MRRHAVAFGSGVIYGTSLIRFINVWAGVGETQEAMCKSLATQNQCTQQRVRKDLAT